MKLKELLARAFFYIKLGHLKDSDKFFFFSIVLLASVVVFLLYLIFSWAANLGNPVVLKILFQWDYIYAFLLWLEIIPLVVLKPVLITYLLIIFTISIMAGLILYLLPQKYAFGCYEFQITENTTNGTTTQTCITTQAANLGLNIAIGGYYTLITIVGAIFVNLIIENNNDTQKV